MNFDQFSIPENSKATLVSLVCENFSGHTNDRESQASLNELKELLHTLGVTTGAMHLQRKKQVEAATLLGAGKLKEIAEEEGLPYQTLVTSILHKFSIGRLVPKGQSKH